MFVTYTSSIIYKIQIEKRERWANRDNRIWLPLKKYGDLGKNEKFSLCSGYNVPLFHIYKRGHYCAGSVELSKHGNHYGQWSGFSS